MDSKGVLYVAERNNARIQVFDQQGNSLAQWRRFRPMIEAARDNFLSLVPKAEEVQLPGLDHSMCTEGPALVAKAVAEFLARQPR